MTREEWIEEAVCLSQELNSMCREYGDKSKLYQEAKQEFIDHITTQCPEK